MLCLMGLRARKGGMPMLSMPNAKTRTRPPFCIAKIAGAVVSAASRPGAGRLNAGGVQPIERSNNPGAPQEHLIIGKDAAIDLRHSEASDICLGSSCSSCP